MAQLYSGVSGVAFFYFYSCYTVVFPRCTSWCFRSLCHLVDTKDQGKWVKNTENDPVNPRKLTKADLYTKEEKKKPSEDFQVMFMESNSQAKCVTDFLKREFNR